MRRYKLDTPPNIPKRLDELESRINWLDDATGILRAYDDASPPALIGIASAISEGAGINITRLTTAPQPRFELSTFQYYDYVVDAEGVGTHTTLFGTDGAYQQALSDGGNRTIFVGDSETAGEAEDIGDLTSDEIHIYGPGTRRITLTAASGDNLFDKPTSGGGGSSTQGRLFFHDISLAQNGAALFLINTALVQMSFDWCDIQAGSQDFISITGVEPGVSASQRFLHMSHCTVAAADLVDGGTIQGAHLDHCVMSVAVLFDGTMRNIEIIGGNYAISDQVWKNVPNNIGITGFHMSDVRLAHSGGNACFELGANTNRVTDVRLLNIHYVTSTASSTFCNLGAANTNNNTGLVLDGLILDGPGSGTAVTIDADYQAVAIGAISYRDWGTNYSGPSGVGEDHGLLSGLLDDDHTIYALLAGRSTGQTLIGGTASGEDLTLQSTSNATRGSIFLGTSSQFELNEATGQLLLPTTGSSAGIIIGGDVQLYRSSANVLTIADSVILSTSGATLLTLEGTSVRLRLMDTDFTDDNYEIVSSGGIFNINEITDAFGFTSTPFRIEAGVPNLAVVIDTTGQLQLGVAGSTGGLLIGADAQLYRSAANVFRTPDSLIIDGTLEVGTVQTYAASNVTTDRTYDANSTTVEELADILGTLIADLRTIGLVN